MKINKKNISSCILLISMVLIQICALIVWDQILSIPGTYTFLLLCIYTILTGAIIISAPQSLRLKFIKIKCNLLMKEKAIILLLCLIILLFGLLMLKYLPPLSHDEIRNFKAAKYFATEGLSSFFKNYSKFYWLGIQHPPLSALIYGLAMRIFGINPFIMQFISLLFGIGTVLIIYYFGRSLNNHHTGLFAVLFMISMPLFLRQITRVSNDTILIFLFLLVIFLTIQLQKKATYSISAFIGLIIGLGLLTKYTMVFIYIILIGYFLSTGQIKKYKYYLLTIFIISLIIFGVWVLIAKQTGVLQTQSQHIAKLSGLRIKANGKLGLLTYWRIQRGLKDLCTKLPAFMGIYNVPIIILSIIRSLRYKNQYTNLILIWITAVFLPVAVILPVYRYVLPAIPALPLLMAYQIQKESKHAERVVILSLLYFGASFYLYIIQGQHL